MARHQQHDDEDEALAVPRSGSLPVVSSTSNYIAAARLASSSLLAPRSNARKSSDELHHSFHDHLTAKPQSTIAVNDETASLRIVDDDADDEETTLEEGELKHRRVQPKMRE